MNKPRVSFIARYLEDDADYDMVVVDGIHLGSKEQVFIEDILDALGIAWERTEEGEDAPWN